MFEIGTKIVSAIKLSSMNSSGVRLPHEYQEVEYIQSSGTQFIDTGMAFTNNTKVDLDICFPVARTGWSGVMGCQYTNVNASWAFGVSSNTATYQQNNRSVDWSWSPDANTKYKITNEDRYIYIDGVQVGYITNTYDVYTTPGNGTIFKVNYTGGSSGFADYASARVYACKIYDSSTLVRNFVPCYRVSDGTIGLYDLVEGKFYANAGTGTFKKGAPVNVWQMPSGYTELAYIGTTGTQFVDTLVFPGNNIQVETDIEVSATDNNLVVFGNYNNGSDNYGGGNYYHLTSYQNAWYWGLNGSETHGGSYSTTVGTKYSLIFNNENSSVVVNNSVVGSCSGTVGYSGTTIALSRRGNNNSNNQWRGKYKYYNFKIYDKITGKYIRDFVACVRDSDGVIGLYDLVTKQFFTNSGSGNFAAGPIVMREGYSFVNSDLVAYYPLDNDSKGKDMKNSFGVATATTDNYDMNDGTYVNNGIGMDGMNYLRFVPSAPILANKNYSMLCFIKLNASRSNYQRIIGIDDGSSTSTMDALLVKTGSTRFFYTSGDTDLGTDIPTGTRVLVGLTSAGASKNAFIIRPNSTLQKIPVSGNNGLGTIRLCLACYGFGSGQPFDGIISDAAFIKKTMSDDDIMSYYNDLKGKYGL